MESDIKYYTDSELFLENLVKLGLRRDLPRARTTVVSPSTAQITGEFLPRISNNLISAVSGLVDRANLAQPDIVKAIAEIMLISGCRVSEALGIKTNSILANGQILLQGLKGSESRLVTPILYNEFWNNFSQDHSSIPAYYSRFFFYRLFKKYGISAQLSANSRSSVTHVLRYIYISNLLESGVDLVAIQNIIGHKSYKSTLHYVQKLINYGEKNN